MNNIRLVGYDEKYAAAAVRMWRLSKEKALGLKDALHSFDAHLNYVTQKLSHSDQIVFALEERENAVVGIIAFDSQWINQLYVDVHYQNSGIGSRLLRLALQEMSGPVQLYTFEINEKAQSFYEKHGFEVIAQGDCDNEEKLPALLYKLPVAS